MGTINLLTAAEYRNALVKQVPLAKHRIVVAAMAMTWDETTIPILKLLLEACQRGVAVHILYDRYSWLPFTFHKWLPSHKIRQQVGQLLAFAKEIELAGGIVSEVGKKWGINPFSHRMHAKISLIDDAIYSFGGVNFTADSFLYADYMCHTQNLVMADQLAGHIEAISRSRSLPNSELLLNDNSVVLLDGGQPGSSIIYDRACELAGQAAQVVYVSQMAPSGRLAKALRGKSTCYFNRVGQATGAGKLGLAIDTWRYGLTNHYKGSTYIHAKFMLFKMRDGSRILLSGSNNFSWRGVAYGTKEIALQSGDPILWDELAHYLQIKIIGP